MEVERREESRAAPQYLLWERGWGCREEKLGGGQAVQMSGQEAEIPLDGPDGGVRENQAQMPEGSWLAMGVRSLGWA